MRYSGETGCLRRHASDSVRVRGEDAEDTAKEDEGPLDRDALLVDQDEDTDDNREKCARARRAFEHVDAAEDRPDPENQIDGPSPEIVQVDVGVPRDVEHAHEDEDASDEREQEAEDGEQLLLRHARCLACPVFHPFPLVTVIESHEREGQVRLALGLW